MARCLICDNFCGDGFLLCKSCYYQKEEIRNKIEDEDDSKIAEQYLEIKKNLPTTAPNINEFTVGLQRLFAFAEIYDNELLWDRLKYDIFQMRLTFVKKANEEMLKRNEEKIIENPNLEFTEEIEMDFRKMNPTDYRTKDGHYVRSSYEKILDDWLFDNKIFHTYEKKIAFGDNRSQCIICDFYLPENDIYIELWGNIDKEYAGRKDRKIIKYAELKKTLIEVEDYHIKNIDDYMDNQTHIYKIKRHDK